MEGEGGRLFSFCIFVLFLVLQIHVIGIWLLLFSGMIIRFS